MGKGCSQNPTRQYTDLKSSDEHSVLYAQNLRISVGNRRESAREYMKEIGYDATLWLVTSKWKQIELSQLKVVKRSRYNYRSILKMKEKGIH